MALFVSTNCFLPNLQSRLGIVNLDGHDRFCGSTTFLHLHKAPQKSKSLSFLLSTQASEIKPRIVVQRKGRSSSTQTAAVRHLMGSVTETHGLRFVVVVARFNEIITKALFEGALSTFKNYSVQEEDIDVVWVPGVLK